MAGRDLDMCFKMIVEILPVQQHRGPFCRVVVERFPFVCTPVSVMWWCFGGKRAHVPLPPGPIDNDVAASKRRPLKVDGSQVQRKSLLAGPPIQLRGFSPHSETATEAQIFA